MALRKNGTVGGSSPSLWYPEDLVHQYLRLCEITATREGWWSEEYFWMLVERGLRWRLEPIYE